MHLRSTKLPIVAVGVLLTVSLCVLCVGETTTAPHPRKRLAHKATSHKAPARDISAHNAAARKNTAKSTHRTSKTSKKAKKTHVRGQAAIDEQRARQIQEALVREHYMNGEPSGTWDDATQQALRRYQADQGWQNKTVPDSRALIRLGLGPDHEHLLNPESAMTSEPQLRARSRSASRAMASSAASSSVTSSAMPTGQSSVPVSVPSGSLPGLSPSR
jgi:hypothetical protein